MLFPKKSFNKINGDSGEKIALNFLKKNKYKILETNFKTSIGEIDIIAKQKSVIVFVEVKYRSSNDFGLPREAVNRSKQNNIRIVATQYLKMTKQLSSPCRCDVIEIIDNDIIHLKNCF